MSVKYKINSSGFQSFSNQEDDRTTWVVVDGKMNTVAWIMNFDDGKVKIYPKSNSIFIEVTEDEIKIEPFGAHE